MYSGFITWMRRVVPRGELIIIGVGVELMIECVAIWFHWNFGNANDSGFRITRLTWLSTCSFVYGMYRIALFHPIADPSYRAWLEQTPWTVDKPLPGGPLQLVPQDLVVICGIILLYRSPSIWMLYFPTLFLVGYQSMLAISARAIGHWRLAYLLGFGLGAVMLFADRPEVAFAASDACFIIGRFTVNQALRTFPWTISPHFDVQRLLQNAEHEAPKRLGWPFDQLKPVAPKTMIPLHDGVCLSFLVGWWSVVVYRHMTPDGRFMCPFVILMSIFAFSCCRVLQYVVSHHSPIGLLGRLLTYRWMIPAYDKIFIAPMLACVVAGVTQITAMQCLQIRMLFVGFDPWPGIIISSIGMTVSLLLLLVAGPNLEVWRMTGQHRIGFESIQLQKSGKSEFVEL